MSDFLKDLKHLLWLFKQTIILGLKGDWNGSREAWFFFKIHWNYQGKRK